MYKIEQIQTGFDQIVNFKSVADSDRYWKYFVENEDVIRAEYVNPLLIADTGYSCRVGCSSTTKYLLSTWLAY